MKEWKICEKNLFVKQKGGAKREREIEKWREKNGIGNMKSKERNSTLKFI